MLLLILFKLIEGLAFQTNCLNVFCGILLVGCVCKLNISCSSQFSKVSISKPGNVCIRVLFIEGVFFCIIMMLLYFYDKIEITLISLFTILSHSSLF